MSGAEWPVGSAGGPTPTYLRRVVDDELDLLLPQLPAVQLDGPKGVGKTETALRRASHVWRLDDPVQRAIVEADPRLVAAGLPPVLIDEWHRVPAVWDTVKREVDAAPAAGRFLLTGSAASSATTHSGAARIVRLRMRPLTLPERAVTSPTVGLASLLAGTGAIGGRTPITLTDYVGEIVRSGLPGLRHLDGRGLRAQLASYVELLVDRDMKEAGHGVRRPATLLAWLRAYAAAVGTVTSYEKIRDAATAGHGDKPAKTTTLPYIDVLTDLRILDPVDAWAPSDNRLQRLSQAPKHHLADPALTAQLLGLDPSALLAGEAGAVTVVRDGTLLGGLFESLATLSVRVFAQAAEAQVRHLRTHAGRHEIDLVVERRDGRVLAVVVKLAAAVSDEDVRHLHWLETQIGDRLIDKVVVSTGPVAYRRADGVAVVPLALLGP
jgi:uncharacterized protein